MIGLPDVLVLVEVTAKALARFQETLSGEWRWASEICGREGHGVAVRLGPGWQAVGASVLDHDCTSDRPCLPERGLALDIASGTSRVRVVGWHAPYAAGDRRHSHAENAAFKQLGYRHFAEWLQQSSRPLVVVLDGNNWTDSVGPQKYAPKGDFWDDERLFHSEDAPHGLSDTLREVIDDDPVGRSQMPVTRRNPSGDYRMDRIYASRDLTIVGAGVMYGDGSDVAPQSIVTSAPDGVRLAPGSDHAYVWAELDVRSSSGTDVIRDWRERNDTRSHERLMTNR